MPAVSSSCNVPTGSRASPRTKSGPAPPAKPKLCPIRPPSTFMPSPPSSICSCSPISTFSPGYTCSISARSTSSPTPSRMSPRSASRSSSFSILRTHSRIQSTFRALGTFHHIFFAIWVCSFHTAATTSRLPEVEIKLACTQHHVADIGHGGQNFHNLVSDEFPCSLGHAISI